MEEKIICPHCKKEMKLAQTPIFGLYCAGCSNCHISVAAKYVKDIEVVLDELYRNQYDFEVRYIDGIVEHARIGGGIRPKEE